MSTLTTKVIITWTNGFDRFHPDLMDMRKQKVYEMTAAGLTDGTSVYLSALSGQRNFVDADAAQEYKDWLLNATKQLSLDIPTVEISPI